MARYRKKKQGSGRWKTFLVIMFVLFFVFLTAYMLLFRVNRFSLVIQPKLDESTVIAQGEFFSDPGVDTMVIGSHFFRKGFSVDAQSSVTHQVNTLVPGTYCVSYEAHWQHLQATETRTVIVRDMDPPKITLISVPGHYTIPGEEYVEEGYSAWDACDGDLTQKVIREEHDGLVTYTVTDQAGYRTSITRKIWYCDPVCPEIILNGEATVYVAAGEGYQEPGWTAEDNVDGDLSQMVQVSGTVDKYLAGTYRLTYKVKDSWGNTTEVFRDVVVEAKGIPDTITPEGKVIYLTFDDGPGPDTQKLLAILDKYDVKATFFVVNSEYNHVLLDIVDGGHSIGIHSVTHSYSTIYASSDAFFHDLLTMQQIIYEQTGVKTCLMRFPGGSSNTVSRFNEGIMTYLTQAVEDNGFRYFDWNVDSNDAGGARDADEVFDNVKAGAANHRVSVVLQHDTKGFSVEAVEQIIIWGLENGYKFLALDMTSPMAHHGVNN